MEANVMEEMASISLRRCESQTELTDERAHSLFVVIGGMGDLTIRHEKIPVSMGRCYYAAPGAKATASPHFNSLDLYHIRFERWRKSENDRREPIWIADLSEWLPEGELYAGDEGRYLEQANALHGIVEQGELVTAHRRRLLFQELLYECVKACVGRTEEQNDSQGAIRRAIRYIREHYREELHRDELAKMANLSPEYFSQQFRAVSGSSLTDYLAEVRIGHVKERLLFTNERLAEIAKAVGYRDEYYLSRKFKNVTGMSPSAYVKSDKKIVSLSPHLTRHLLALGIVPAATLTFPWGFGDDQERMDEQGCVCRSWDKGFSDEELLRMEPELLLCIDNVSPDRLSFYRGICPTLVIPWYLSDWRGHFREVARAIDRRAQAENWLKVFAAKADATRNAIREVVGVERTVLIYNVRGDAAFVYRNRAMGSQVIYDELGMRMPVSVQARPAQGNFIPVEPWEVLPAFSADCILLSVDRSPEARERADRMLESSEWTAYANLPGKRICEVDMARWHGYDPLSILWQLEDASRLFALRECK